MLEKKCVGDNFEAKNGQNRHQDPISLNISVGHKHSKDVTDIEILSPIPKNCHQHLCSLLKSVESLVDYLATMKISTNVSSRMIISQE